MAKKKLNRKPTVVLLYDELLAKEPNLNEQVEKVTQLFKSCPSDSTWKAKWDEERIGFPITISLTLCSTAIFDPTVFLGSAASAFSPSLLAGLIAWGESKMIYRFDPDFANELGKTGGFEKIPIDVLLHMPFKSIDLQVGDTEYLVFLDQNMREAIYELRVEKLNRERLDSIMMVLDLSSDTLQGCIDHTIAETCRHSDTPAMRSKVSAWQAEQTQTLISVIQMLLYIQSDTADIEIDTENASARKRYPRKAIPTLTNAGYRIGSDIRKVMRHRKVEHTEEASATLIPQTNDQPAINPAAEDGTSHGSPKSAHIRRAHWHHFWTGSKETRQLKLRWVAPMAIRPDLESERIPTIRNVK